MASHVLHRNKCADVPLVCIRFHNEERVVMGLLSWVVFGLVTGAIARFFVMQDFFGMQDFFVMQDL